MVVGNPCFPSTIISSSLPRAVNYASAMVRLVSAMVLAMVLLMRAEATMATRPRRLTRPTTDTTGSARARTMPGRCPCCGGTACSVCPYCSVAIGYTLACACDVGGLQGPQDAAALL